MVRSHQQQPSRSPATSDVTEEKDDHSFSISHVEDGGDDNLDNSSASGSGGNISGSNKSTRSSDHEIAARRQQVACTRCLAFFLVLATAAAAGVTTYVLTSQHHEGVVEQHYFELNEEVLVTSRDYFIEIATFMEDMSTAITALATSSNVSWPYYTQSNFATTFGQAYLNNSGATLISWSPIVEGEFGCVEWGQYSTEHASQWMPTDLATGIPSMIYSTDDVSGLPFIEQGDGPFVPVWEVAIPFEPDRSKQIDPSIINYNALDNDVFARTLDAVLALDHSIMTPIMDATDIFGHSVAMDNDIPTSLLLTPVYATMNSFLEEGEERDLIVGTLVAVLPWTLFYKEVLHPSQPRVTVVVDQVESCSGGGVPTFTMEIVGESARYLGPGIQVDDKFLPHGLSMRIDPRGLDEDHECYFTITAYPTQEGFAAYHGDNENAAAIWTSIVVCVILLAGSIFFVYDYAVQRRMMKTMSSAAKTNAVLASLFPSEVRDRLMGRKPKDSGGNGGDDDNVPKSVPMIPQSTTYRLKNYLAGEDGAIPSDEKVKEALAEIDMHDTKPIAELFPNTTVLFADIAGFTAWSSVREPSQVFTLLETVYQAFDAIAKKRKVFKVETVGDCYVAVAGLPEAREDHAIVMAKFAKECLIKFNELAKQLEIALGPDTGDLTLRAGLNSGPVTAGVLRGDRSRFQLFGETVVTAARVEATGMKNRVHLSDHTAKLLIAAGKEHWFQKREDVVTAKGKGELQTHWLITQGMSSTSKTESSTDPEAAHRVGMNLEELEASLPPKIQRLVGWNVEILKRLLQQMIAKRNAIPSEQHFEVQLTRVEKSLDGKKQLLKEMTEIIALPKFDASAHKDQQDPSTVKIPDEVVKELKLYVCSIAAMHRDNHFHNFEHASHVTMSVSKLLSRIVTPSDIIENGGDNLASALHDHTFGITSDPLSHFSMVLSALIHDTDHLGVSNAQLVKEKHNLAKFHQGKSVAEQNSVVLAWTKLMDPAFLHLRRVIYGTPAELERFRQIVVNNVLATDIFDKELQTMRKNRWEKAFSASGDSGSVTAIAEEDEFTAINRKATVVMEHLIQASDVSHTMQHWQIFRKWNERLFAEMNTAYVNGRLAFDPKAGWYQGELSFFDNYIIPLAKKLKDCGVFGVSCDEYLNYALENRREWAMKGESVVASYIEKYCEDVKQQEHVQGEQKPSSQGKK